MDRGARSQLLCACSLNVAVDYDKSTDFSRYRTYGW